MRLPSPLRPLAAAVLAFAVSAPALADDFFGPDHSATKPAVSTINGKLGLFGGTLSDEEIGGISGALAIPLGHRFGLQFDGMFGSVDDDPFYGVGAHLFWRDPSRGLIGAYASYVSWDASTTVAATDLEGGVRDIDGADVGKVGLEAEAYLGRISLEGLAAYQFGTEHGFAGKATLAYYPVDDLRLDISVRHLEGQGVSAGASAEWALPAHSGLSLLADASVNDDSDWRALAGVIFHFGAGEKSLIRRHREDDPSIDLPEDLQVGAPGKSRCPDLVAKPSQCHGGAGTQPMPGPSLCGCNPV
jgi:hypothetical protein